MSGDSEKLVFDLVARQVGKQLDQITPDQRLLHDLGIDGDDADEMLRELATHCHVDVTHFDFRRYFRSEPSLLSLFWFLPEQKKDRLENKMPLRVSDLVRAVETGRLDPTA